jgi:hypothetical protein
MPKYEIYETEKQTLPSADSPEYKQLVEQAPYHPGYEGVIPGLEISMFSTHDIVKLDGWNLQPMVSLNTDPKPQDVSIDWSKLTFTSGMVTGSGGSGGALKFDGDKLPVNLLSTEALNQTAAVLKFGADKYHAHNWRDGFAWSRPLAAAMRHIMAFNDGEDKDPESGLSHLAHAACCIMFLLEFEKTHPELDDRYKVDVSNTNKTSK